MQNESVSDDEYAEMGLTPEQIEVIRRLEAGEDAPEGTPVPLEVRKPLKITRVPRKQPAGS